MLECYYNITRAFQSKYLADRLPYFGISLLTFALLFAAFISTPKDLQAQQYRTGESPYTNRSSPSQDYQVSKWKKIIKSSYDGIVFRIGGGGFHSTFDSDLLRGNEQKLAGFGASYYANLGVILHTNITVYAGAQLFQSRTEVSPSTVNYTHYRTNGVSPLIGLSFHSLTSRFYINGAYILPRKDAGELASTDLVNLTENPERDEANHIITQDIQHGWMVGFSVYSWLTQRLHLDLLFSYQNMNGTFYIPQEAAEPWQDRFSQEVWSVQFSIGLN